MALFGVRACVIAGGVAGLLGGTVAASASSPRSVAVVGSTPILVTTYVHWERVERHSNPGESAHARRQAAMNFLITAAWIRGEAAARAIIVTDAEVTARLNRLRHDAYPTSRAFERFLRSTGQTVTDLKFRERLDLLTARLATSGNAANLVTTWRPRTLCKPKYQGPDCGGTLTGV